MFLCKSLPESVSRCCLGVPLTLLPLLGPRATRVARRHPVPVLPAALFLLLITAVAFAAVRGVDSAKLMKTRWPGRAVAVAGPAGPKPFEFTLGFTPPPPRGAPASPWRRSSGAPLAHCPVVGREVSQERGGRTRGGDTSFTDQHARFGRTIMRFASDRASCYSPDGLPHLKIMDDRGALHATTLGVSATAKARPFSILAGRISVARQRRCSGLGALHDRPRQLASLSPGCIRPACLPPLERRKERQRIRRFSLSLFTGV